MGLYKTSDYKSLHPFAYRDILRPTEDRVFHRRVLVGLKSRIRARAETSNWGTYWDNSSDIRTGCLEGSH